MPIAHCLVRLLRAAGVALVPFGVLFSIPVVLAQASPGVVSASIDGQILSIAISEELATTSSAVASDFTVSFGEETITVSSVEVSGATVKLTLTESAPDRDCTDSSFAVSYSADDSSLIGANGGEVESFAQQAVTNETDKPPEIVSMETDASGRVIHVLFCESIDDLSYLWSDFSAFSILVNGTRRPVNDLLRRSDSPERLDIHLSGGRAIKEGETVTLAYDQDSGDEDYPLRDLDQGNLLVASWSARTVTNNVDGPPTLQSVSALYDIVTLTFSETLDEDSVPDADSFTIGGVQHAPSVDEVKVAGAAVTLTTSAVLLNRNAPTYTLSYSEPNDSPLRQADGAHNVADISSYEFMSSTPDTRPTVEGAQVDGATLTITFDLPLKAVAPASAFSIAGEDGISVTATSFSGSEVALTLSPGVSTGSTITVSYTVPDSPPRIEARNARDAEAFSAQSVTNKTAAPAPEVSGATVSADGTALTITLSLPLNATSAGLPDKSTFTLSGTSAAVASVSVAGSSVSLELRPIADVNETITVSYTPPTDQTDSRLQSSAHGKAVAAFSNQSVTNNTDGKPRPLSATVAEDEIVITFDRGLDDQSEPVTTALAIGGVTATVSGVAISGKSLTLTISPAVTHLDTITIGYTSPMDMPLKRAGSSLLVDSFSGQSVTNNTKDPTPAFGSASVDATGRTLTIVMSHPLLATSAGTPSASTFTLSGTTQAEVESVSVSGSSVELTLDPATDLNETVSVSYQPPTDSATSALQSLDGVWKTAGWSNESVTNNADGVPRLLGGTVNGSTLVLRFDRVLDENAVPPKADFSITPSEISVSGVDVEDDRVTLTLSAALEHDDGVTVAYSAADTVKLKRDGRALDVAAFSGIEVENETPEPLLRSVVGDGDSIVLTFTKTLDTSAMPDATAFSLGADQPKVTEVTVASLTVTLALGRALAEGAAYTLTYAVPTTSPLTTSDSSQVPAFSEAVTNNTDVAPTAETCTATYFGIMVYPEPTTLRSTPDDSLVWDYGPQHADKHRWTRTSR